MRTNAILKKHLFAFFYFYWEKCLCKHINLRRLNMNINDKTIISEAEIISKALFGKGLNDVSPNQLHTAVSRSIMAQIAESWKTSREKQKYSKFNQFRFV